MSLYMWGSNSRRQLVNISSEVVSTPTHVVDKLLENQIPLQVAAGNDHSIVLTEAGDVFVYGTEKMNHRKVQGLDHETIVHVAAGAHSSFAVSNTGKVYHWGLIHEDVNPDVGGESASSAPADEDAQSGALTGLAQDQTTVVSVDVEARNTSYATHQARRARQLREIVRDSTEQWMLPTGDAEREYYDELRSMGYAVEEAEERMQERGREYHGMLRMGCKRVPQSIPRLVPHLKGIRIVSVSAGYAHVMLISDKGLLYAAGYNDRGQLGLGHRINTSVFKLVDFLSTKFVLQVVCGQQHTLCRAVDRSLADSSLTVGSDVQSDVYSWGNGMLGQLGLGIKGTSKGRLFPTIIPFFQQNFPLGVSCVGAGANFSSVVVYSGDVYSFGHSEYNQHGTGSSANRDYVDPYHFFVPRKVIITDPAKAEPVRIRSLSCGAMFTIAVSDDGNLYSWGWNEGGVLGHGVNYFSSSPQRIGNNSEMGEVTQLVCGAKHVIVIRQDLGAMWSQTYQSILKELINTDLVITIDNPTTSNVLAQTNKTPVEYNFRCHRAIVGNRCRYLRGIIDMASYQQSLEDIGRSNTSANVTETDHSIAIAVPAITSIHLSGTHFNAVTMRALLDYFYINRVNIAAHKRREFLLVAQELMLDDLANMLAASIQGDGAQVRQLRLQSILTYETHIRHLFGSKEEAEVAFVVHHANNQHHGCDESVFTAGDYAHVHMAHKFIVHRIPYFEAFMESNFKDSVIYSNFIIQDSLRHTMTRKIQVIDVSFLLADGIDFDAFLKVILYAYTGKLTSHAATTESEDTPQELSIQEIMQLLALSNRLGYSSLAQFCERRISLAIAFHTPEEVFHCYEFAQYYNLPRLEMQCLAVLRHVGYEIPVSSEDETDEDEGSEPKCP